MWTLFYVVEAGPSFPGKEKVCLLLLMEKQKNCRILLQSVSYTHLDVYKRQIITIPQNNTIRTVRQSGEILWQTFLVFCTLLDLSLIHISLEIRHRLLDLKIISDF